MPATRVERQAAPLRQQVVRLLREDILAGDLIPGQRLRETSMCESYGVSRTVVREALRQLESESLITVLPNKGPIVTVLTKKDIESLYEVRRALEGLLGELFACNASDEQARQLTEHFASMDRTYLDGNVVTREESNDEFYALLMAGAGNDVLAASLRAVHTRIGLFRRYAFVDGDRVAVSMRDLGRIAREAAGRRDPAGARAACEAHIRRAGELAVIEYSNRFGRQTP